MADRLARGAGTYDALVWAERQTCGGPGPKAVLLALARMAGLGSDGRWTCYPGQALLAGITEQSERTVRRQLADLEARGLIAREVRMRGEGRGRTSDRTVLLLQPAESAGWTSDEQPATDDGPTGQPGPTNRPLVSARKNQGSASEEPDARSAETSGAAVEVLEPDGFAEWWQAYPRKVGKPAALRAYRKATKSAEPAAILDGLVPWLAYWKVRAEPEFVPHPATWLNQERWNDAAPPPPAPRGGDGLAVLDALGDDWRPKNRANGFPPGGQERSIDTTAREMGGR